SGTPTKLLGVAYRRLMTASGTTDRTSTNPAARALSLTGGTPAAGEPVVVATTVMSAVGPGDAVSPARAPQPAQQAITSRVTVHRRAITFLFLFRSNWVSRGNPPTPSVRPLNRFSTVFCFRPPRQKGIKRARDPA